MKYQKIIILIIILAVASGIYLLLKEYLTLEYVKNIQSEIYNYYLDNKILSIFIYFLLYILIIAISIPGATILTLLAGAIFGFSLGVIIVSFASSIGATLSFLISRFLIGQSLQKKYPDKLTKINQGMREEGNFYLFSLRLIPLFPFFLINLLMGLTKIKIINFYLITQIGSLAGTMAYVYAGVSLNGISSVSDILTLPIILSFTILGLLPLISKKILNLIKFKIIKKN